MRIRRDALYTILSLLVYIFIKETSAITTLRSHYHIHTEKDIVIIHTTMNSDPFDVVKLTNKSFNALSVADAA